MTAGHNKEQQHQRLRELILGADYNQKLADSRTDTERVAEVISEAIEARSQQDNSLGEAFSPTLESSLTHAIKKDPTPIIEAIFPVITPALRKAINAAISELVLSFNQLLEKSLSPKSIIWRFQAWRSGQNYAEFILLKTLRYRVEQVILIDRHSSLVMAMKTAAQVQSQDPEQVSAMLSAISDFVSDSFSADGENQLEAIRLGDFVLEMATSPTTILVAAVRGISNAQIKQQLVQTQEALYSKCQKQLQNFKGRRLEDDKVDELLTDCLLEQRIESQQKARKPWAAIVIFAAFIAASAYYGFLQYRWQMQSTQIIQALQAEQGYLVIEQSRSFKHLNLSLLRSPLAKLPTQIIANIEHDLKITITQRYAPIGDMQVFLGYIKDRLKLDDTIKLSLKNGHLKLQGAISQKQLTAILESRFLSHLAIKHIQLVQTAVLKRAKPITNWQTQDQLNIQYQEQINNAKLQYQKELKTLIQKLNQLHILFPINQINLDVRKNISMQQALKIMRRMQTICHLAKLNYPDIIIMGFSDSKGLAKINQRFSLQRATFIKNWLVDNDIASQSLMVSAMGSFPQSALPHDKQRRVAFYATYIPLNLTETTP